MRAFKDWELGLLRAMEGPLPLVEKPFAELADRAGVSEGQAIARIKAWMADGTIRRFGARVNHRTLGFTANGMSVWRVPAGDIDDVAAFMIQQREVSHCYLRAPSPQWDYSLYAMIHGASRDAVLATAAYIAEATGQPDYEVLFTVKEFKKSAPRYFAEET